MRPCSTAVVTAVATTKVGLRHDGAFVENVPPLPIRPCLCMEEVSKLPNLGENADPFDKKVMPPPVVGGESRIFPPKSSFFGKQVFH